MIIDALTNDISSEIFYDVCIIGAGPAGITTAIELAKDSKLNVAILEAGGIYYEHRAQSLFMGEVDSERHPSLWRTRFSVLGGSSKIWAGWCRPLNSLDFEKRDYIKNSGWPFGLDELEAVYRRANEICGLGSYDYDTDIMKNLLSGSPLLENSDLGHPIYQIRKLHFNDHYYNCLESAENISLYLHSPVLRLWPDEGGDRVSRVEIGSYSGGKSKLRSKNFVLAGGGVENARLLLLSGSGPGRALGNQNDCVGRYFIDHGFIDPGWFKPNDSQQNLQYYFPVPHPHNPSEACVRPVITLAPEVLKREKLLNGAMFFYPGYESHRIFASDAVKSALELWEIVKGKNTAELWEMFKGQLGSNDLWRFTQRIASRPHYILQAILRKAIINNSSVEKRRIRFYYECIPSTENRVMLSTQKDRFNRPQARLISRLSKQDIDSARRTLSYLNDVFQKNNVGQLTYFDEESEWRNKTETAAHPSGSTRMNDNPKLGVVDKNCRVHGLQNLFVAGSSVLPTVGYANPTLTIVALAIRLSEFLKQQLANPARSG